MGLGSITTSEVFLTIIVALVVTLSISGNASIPLFARGVRLRGDRGAVGLVAAMTRIITTRGKKGIQRRVGEDR
jgi:hypothetical protein